MIEYSEQEIEIAFEYFVCQAQKIVSEYMDENFPTLPKQEIIVSEGNIYWKLARKSDINFSSTVHAFVRKNDGAIFRAASWKSPQTKGKSAIRAYVTDEWASDVLTPHGVAYAK
jgi:hypothetical protein